MRSKIYYILMISILLISCSVASAININQNNKNVENSLVQIDKNESNLPIWQVEDSWIYNINLNGGLEDTFYLNNIKMYNLEFKVEEVQTDAYKLHMESYITGSVDIELGGISLKGSLQNVNLEGTVYVNKSLLVVYKAENIQMSGYIKPSLLPRIPFNLEGQLLTDYTLPPIMFPLDPGDNWNIPYVFGIFDFSVNALGQTIDESISFNIGDHDMNCTGIETVETDEADYDAYLITSDLGLQHDIWYSSSAGTIVKITSREILLSGGGWGTYDFDMTLKHTTHTALGAPDKPETPIGPNRIKDNVEKTYKTSTNDPDGDQLYYWFDWGDGTNSGWLGPYDSGEEISASHTWKNRGSYQIELKAKDTNGLHSLWADPLSITVPKQKKYSIAPINLLQKYLKYFPFFNTGLII